MTSKKCPKCSETKNVSEFTGDIIFNEFIPVKVQPAARPRISKYGSYYPKAYTDFRKEMYMYLKTLKSKFKAVKGQYDVDMEFVCYKPKNPSNPYPRYDTDNIIKAYLDSFTYAQLFWEDDIEVITIRATKRYQEKNEPYGAFIKIYKR